MSLVMKTRTMIECVLVTDGPVHIGSGLSESKPRVKGEKSISDIAAVSKDSQQRPYLPGSAIKGNIRSWLTKHNSSDLIDEVFGKQDRNESEKSVGGKVDFLNAYVVGDPPVERLTKSDVGVAIERRTRTADENKLFHKSLIPAGVRFRVQITGDNLEPKELELLLEGLSGFSHAEAPITLGARTHDGWGRFRLESLQRKEISQDRLVEWLKSPFNTSVDDLYQTVASPHPSSISIQQSQLKVDLQLEFVGPFLVNDPVTAAEKNEGKDEDGRVDCWPMQTDDGRILLAARSFRGVLRSHAERIVRTLLADSKCAPFDLPADDPGQQLIHSLFGKTGSATLLKISDFVSSQSPKLQRREFVGIDRFHGGSSKSVKFNALVADSPTLTGSMSFDLSRAETCPKPMLGLLMLVLRDILEGDLKFGMGASKGFGTGFGTIADLKLPKREILEPLISDQALHLLSGKAWGQLQQPDMRDGAIEEVKSMVRKFREHLQKGASA